MGRAEGEEVVHDGGLARPAQEVEVQSRGIGRSIGDRLEAEVEEGPAAEVQAGAVVVVGDRVRAERRGPELTQSPRLAGVPDDVLQVHAVSIAVAAAQFA